MTEWKVLGRRMCSCHGGTAQWVPGERMSVRGKLVPCNNGLHICRDEEDLLGWLGEVICPVVERSDEYVDADGKRVCRWVVIGPPNAYWDERTARHFACDCAEYVLPHARDDQRELLQAVIDIARAYADWPKEWIGERAAAYDAAWIVVGDAAWAAAADAAVWVVDDAAGWAVANAVTLSAGWVAAGTVASNAVWAAPQDTAKADLAAILATYLDGTSEWVLTDKEIQS